MGEVGAGTPVCRWRENGFSIVTSTPHPSVVEKRSGLGFPSHAEALRQCVEVADDVGAVVAASALLASGAEAGAAGEKLAERLLRRGFRGAARVLGAPSVVLLATAEDLRPARTADLEALAASLDRALHRKSIPQGFLARAHHARGRLMARAGRFAEAADAFRKALAHDPKYPRAASDLAEVLLCEGRADEAAAFLDLAARNGDGARHLAVAASLAEARGEITAASTLLDQAARALESADGGRRRVFADACRHGIEGAGLSRTAPLLDLIEQDAQSPEWPGGESRQLRRRGALLADRVGAVSETRGHLEHLGDGPRRDLDMALVAARAALLAGDPAAALKAVTTESAARCASLATLAGLAMVDMSRHAEGVAVLTASAVEGCVAAEVGLAEIAVRDRRYDLADAHLAAALKSTYSGVQKARIGVLRALLRESEGDGLGAVCALAEALCGDEDPVARARYVTLTIDMALRAHDDPHARQHFLDRALDAVEGSEIGDGLAVLPVSMAEWMVGRTPRLSVKEIDAALATAASLSAAESRGRLRHEDWVRVRRAYRPSVTATPRPVDVDVRRHGLLPKTPSLVDPSALRRLAVTLTRGVV